MPFDKAERKTKREPVGRVVTSGSGASPVKGAAIGGRPQLALSVLRDPSSADGRQARLALDTRPLPATPQPKRLPRDFAKFYGLSRGDRKTLEAGRKSVFEKFVSLANDKAKKVNPGNPEIGVTALKFDPVTGEARLRVVKYTGCGSCASKDVTERLFTRDLVNYCRDPNYQNPNEPGEPFIWLDKLEIDFDTLTKTESVTCMAKLGKIDTGLSLALEGGPTGLRGPSSPAA